jgi:D-glycero-alpha-D-manno-heptose 1-phosphate guanylyltransferase
VDHLIKEREALPIRALVLAGGLGKRLRPVVSGVPKPLAIVEDRTFLDILIDLLAKKGVRDFLMLTGYKGDLIRHHFERRPLKGVRIDCLRESEPLGTGGAIKNAQHRATDPSLIVYGDSFLDASVKDLMEFHLANDSDVTMCLYPVEDVSRYGSVEIDRKNRIRAFYEKDQAPPGPGYINAGFYFVSKAFIQGLPENMAFSMESDFFPKYAIKGRMFGMVVDGSFFDIGSPESYEAFKDFAALELGNET